MIWLLASLVFFSTMVCSLINPCTGSRRLVAKFASLTPYAAAAFFLTFLSSEFVPVFLFSGHWMQTNRTVLAAIRNKDGIEGHFFLGSGLISDQPYYFYYEHLQDNGYRPGKLAAGHDVTVYEESRQDAEMITYNFHMDYPSWASLLFFPAQPSPDDRTYSFHVPNGTIKPGYAM